MAFEYLFMIADMYVCVYVCGLYNISVLLASTACLSDPAAVLLLSWSINTHAYTPTHYTTHTLALMSWAYSVFFSFWGEEKKA